jgi:hypothetical protein
MRATRAVEELVHVDDDATVPNRGRLSCNGCMHIEEVSNFFFPMTLLF